MPCIDTKSFAPVFILGVDEQVFIEPSPCESMIIEKDVNEGWWSAKAACSLGISR